jgi:hypothetical protein
LWWLLCWEIDMSAKRVVVGIDNDDKNYDDDDKETRFF